MKRAALYRSLIVAMLAGAFAGIVLFRLPFCPLASVLGVPCPGCGLTRATLALAQGNLQHALELHPLVVVLAPLFIWAMTSAAVGYVRGPAATRPVRPWLASRTVTALASLLLLATLGVWGGTLLWLFRRPSAGRNTERLEPHAPFGLGDFGPTVEVTRLVF